MSISVISISVRDKNGRQLDRVGEYRLGRLDIRNRYRETERHRGRQTDETLGGGYRDTGRKNAISNFYSSKQPDSRYVVCRCEVRDMRYEVGSRYGVRCVRREVRGVE